MIPVTQPTTFQSASLYVGDLHNEVTESTLFDQFSQVGTVASIRVCRDSITRRSLGYAYVNFINVKDAELALDTMNFADIKGKPCRIMWSQRDPSLRKSGVGNIFVRNLPQTVDNKGLYDTFSVFGHILSCKVVTDEKGASKGYGYVHFETAEAAADAIQKFNGTMIDDVEVQVGIFVRKQDRADQADWTNLYVKQFPSTYDETKLRDIFSVYGIVVSVAISKDNENKAKGFGFVNFSEHESAKKALEELSNKVIEDPAGPFELYVSKAQKKSDRTKEIKSKFDALNHERASKYQGMNLYVKNISDSVTDEMFREMFTPFGTITSARIMKDVDGKTSKGFGFICYSSPEEATRAVTEMNNKVIQNKPLVVTLHQRKEQRRAHLAATYAPQNIRGFPQGMTPNGMPMTPYMGMYLPQGQQPYGQQGPRGNVMPFVGPGFPGGNPMGGRGPGGMVPQNRNMPFPRPGGNQFYQGGPMPQQFLQQQNVGGPLSIQQPGMQPGMQPGGRPGEVNSGYPVGGMQPGMNRPGVMGQQQMMQQGGMHQGGRGPPRGPPGGRGGNMGMQQNGMVGMMGPNGVMPGARPMYGQAPPQQQMRGAVKFSNQARNQQSGGQMNMPQGMPPQNIPQQMQQQPQGMNSAPEFSDAVLANADALTQKNMIGERLYPLIYTHQPEQAGKITGMLLEMDNSELLNLIESPDALMSKIDEALNVLRNHKPEG